MKFTITACLAAIVGLAQATAHGTGYPHPNGTVTTTVITTDYETYCPSPTTFIHKNVTYTATEPTTITITNCPCTITTSQPPPITTTHLPPPGEPDVPAEPTVIIPPPETSLIGVSPVPVPSSPGAEPTNVPTGPSDVPTEPTSVPTAAAAEKVGAGFGALVLAGAAAIIL